MGDSNPLFARHLEWVAITREADRRALLNGAASAGCGAGAAAVVSNVLGRAGVQSVVRRLTYLDYKTWVPDDVLAKVDRMSMAVSIEARVPFLDHQLVEFVAGLPYRINLKHETKHLLREAVSSMLPARTRSRRKQPFRVPLRGWFRAGLRELLVETLTTARARERGLIRPEGVAALIREHMNGTRDRSQALWALLCFELWMREVVDSTAAAHR
jgi:asparagine synthase (glutamine-hydrolysing)